jgi:alpha-ketoglutarate-dependent taurine dioxygenase
MSLSRDTRFITEPIEIPEHLLGEGLVFFRSPQTRRSLIALAQSLGNIVPHRDSDPDGITVIEDRAQSQLEYRGLTNLALDPHTDRSSEERPPRLILNYCTLAASEGGEVVLADARAVYDILTHTQPRVISLLERPDAVGFSDGSKTLVAPVFSRDSSGRVRVRFKFDSSLVANDDTWWALKHFKATIEEHSLQIPLHQGEGYIVDNSWWLHGRRQFSGSRQVLRLHIQSLDDQSL